jgi:hypothetical protein
MAKEEEIKLKDMLRAIEAGEIEEDLDLPDPEQYDDMGGIKSLDKGAPSIKMASETPEEEFGLELDSLYREWKDKIEKGLFDGPFEDYADKYFSYKKQINENRKMAMYGGRMQYANGMNPDTMQSLPSQKDFKFNELIDKDAEEEYYKNKAIELDKKYNPQNYMDEINVGLKGKEGVSKPKIDLTPSVVEKLKKLLKKREEDQIKRAKGGIAGVL